MALFERGYRAAAKTELERDIRNLEERDKPIETALANEEVQDEINRIQNNIMFAQRLNLISQEQAKAYEERIQTVAKNNELLREENEKLTEDQYGPNEHSERFFNLKEVQADIQKEKSNSDSKRAEKSDSKQDYNHETEERNHN